MMAPSLESCQKDERRDLALVSAVWSGNCRIVNSVNRAEDAQAPVRDMVASAGKAGVSRVPLRIVVGDCHSENRVAIIPR